MTLRVTLCIVNFNGARHLPHALRALDAQDALFDEILLVDDASTDDSVELARRLAPRLHVIVRQRNGGPGAARNDGFRAARNDLVLFQDNDVRLQPGTAARLVRLLAMQPQALLVSPRVLLENDPRVIQYDGADLHYLGLMAPRNAYRTVEETACDCRATGSMVTCCFLVDRRRWPTDEPPFDATLGFNLEDHDFGVRANALGLETWIEAAAIVTHAGGTPDLSYRPGRVVPSARIFYLLRNRWLIICRTYQLRTLLLLAPMLVTFELFQLAGAVRRGWLRQWLAAAGSFLARLPDTLRRRARLQSHRRRPDRELLACPPLPFTAAVRGGAAESAVMRWLERTVARYWKAVRPHL